MAWFSTSPGPFGQLRLGVLQINRLIAMRLGNKTAALSVNTPQKNRFLAVSAVNADVAELK